MMITALILSILFLWWFIWFCKTQDIKDAKEFEENWKKETNTIPWNEHL